MTTSIRNRRPKKQHDADQDSHNESSSSKSFLFSNLLPVPLRNCLSGQEPKRKGSIIIEEETSSSSLFDSVPMLRRSVCSNESVIVNDKGDAINNNTNSNIKSQDISSRNTSTALGAGPSGECQSVSDDIHNVTMGSYTTVSSLTSENMESEYDFETSDKAYSFLSFRLSYLFVTLVVMLADGLQGK
jgi:hypothetical protein